MIKPRPFYVPIDPVPARGFLVLSLAIIILCACQFQEEASSLQVESPQISATKLPPSQNFPIVSSLPTLKLQNKPADASNAPSKNLSSPSAPKENFNAVPLPTPDLPSLAHLLSRNSEINIPETRIQRPIVPPPTTTNTVRAAILLPLSGRNIVLGEAMLNAAKLAIFDFADRRLELLPVDTKGTPEGAQEAATLAIGDRAEIILGPLLATSVHAVAPLARAAGVPVIAFSSDRSVAGSGVYTMGFVPEDQVRRVVKYAFQKSLTRFAILAPDNTYGTMVVKALNRTIEAIGARLVDSKFYDPKSEDFTAVVRDLARYDERRNALLRQRAALEEKNDNLSKRTLQRLKSLQTIGELPFDALLVADGGKRLQSLAALLPFYDIDPSKVRMLGLGQWDVPGIGAEPALLGGWYAAPQPSARAEFAATYFETFGVAPPRLATLAYDVAALTAVLAMNSRRPNFSAAKLTVPNGFEGRDGIFRFLPSGVAERGLAVLQVQRRNSTVISPAPRTFQMVLN